MARRALDVLKFENLLRMGVFWTVAIIASYLSVLFQMICRSPAAAVSFPRSSPKAAHEDKEEEAGGLACIVTGASSGIGKATAEALALHGYHVILAGRSLKRLLKVVTELKKKHLSISLEAQELDLCSADSILHFKNEVRTSLRNSRPPRELQLLVNNAGILAGYQRWTAAGFDSTMASNYLGPYLLTQQLLPMLLESRQSRIVNVVSFTHRCVKKLHVDEENLTRGSMQRSTGKQNWYRVAQVYETSKLCVLLFTYELHRRLSMTAESSKISVLAADPGVVQTNIMQELPRWLERLAQFMLKLLGLLQLPQIGANAVVDAALAPEGLSSQYFFGGSGRVLKSSPLSYDSVLAKQLWETTSSVWSVRA